MSILMKKPRIEEIADALGDAKKTLLSVLDGPGEYARFDLEKGPLPVGGAPLVRRSILSYKGREYPGVYLRTTLGSHFIEVSGKEECATYEVDEANRSLRKVDEPLSAEELRRVLGGGSGGGSGLPDDYAQQLQSLIQFTGNKTEVGGDLEVYGNVSADGGNIGLGSFVVDGNPVTAIKYVYSEGGMTLPLLWIPQGVLDSSTNGVLFTYVTVDSDSALQNDFTVQGHSIEESVNLAYSSSQAKYQHTVIISGEGFEFCFTAMSSNNLVVDSYQALGTVFGGKRIGLTGYSHALSAKPVLIDLHGGSVNNDFIRVFEENGNTFANHTLSSLGAITFSDDVYPN